MLIDLKKPPIQPRAPPIIGSISAVKAVPNIILIAVTNLVPMTNFANQPLKYPSQNNNAGSIIIPTTKNVIIPTIAHPETFFYSLIFSFISVNIFSI